MSLTISRLQRLAGINESTLEESAQSKYIPMFSAILDAPELAQNREDIEHIANQTIAKVRNKFKRTDIITWVLRYSRLSIIMNMAHGYVSPEGRAKLARIDEQYRAEMIKAGESVSRLNSSIFDVVNDDYGMLSHYLAMPIPEIQQYRFSRVPASEVFANFRTIEKVWKGKASQTVDQEEHHEVVMDFGDGWAWVDLKQAYCEVEGKAMEHCGNEGDQYNTSDTILSLRKKQKDGKLRPSLTFILDYNGMLGEMKGRRNQKPSEKYHKYIIPLIRSDIVKGIKGGGWDPDNNFSILDLSEDEQEVIMNQKPELMGLEYYHSQFGWDNPQFQEAMKKRLESGGLSYIERVHQNGRGLVTVDSWENSKAFATHIKDDTLINVIDTIEYAKTYDGSDRADNHRWLNALRKRLGIYYMIGFNPEIQSADPVLYVDVYSDSFEEDKIELKIPENNFVSIVDKIGAFSEEGENDPFDPWWIANAITRNDDWYYIDDWDDRTDEDRENEFGVGPGEQDPLVTQYHEFRDGDGDLLPESRNTSTDISRIKRLAGI